MDRQLIKSRCLAGLFAAITVGGMALFFNTYNRWTPIGPNRIIDGGFEQTDCVDEWTGWDSGLTRRDPGGGFDGSAGIVFSTESNRNGVLRMTITDTENIPAFQVSLRAATWQIRSGPQNLQHPRAIFFYTDPSGKPLFNRPHGVFDLQKDSDWQTYQNTFPVPEETKDARFQIQNLGIGGVLSVDDVSVVPVMPRLSASFFGVYFVVLWILALAVCLIVLGPWKTLPAFAVLFYTIAIIIGVLLPGELLDGAIEATATITHNAKQRLERPAPAVSPPPAVQTAKPEPMKSAPCPAPIKPHQGDLVSKAHQNGHFLLFMILAFCAMKNWAPAKSSGLNAVPVTAGLFLFAAATETLQFATLDRSPGLTDLGVDISGILIAVVVSAVVSQIYRTLHKRRR